jgi:hypothetical protein
MRRAAVRAHPALRGPAAKIRPARRSRTTRATPGRPAAPPSARRRLQPGHSRPAAKGTGPAVQALRTIAQGPRAARAHSCRRPRGAQAAGASSLRVLGDLSCGLLGGPLDLGGHLRRRRQWYGMVSDVGAARRWPLGEPARGQLPAAPSLNPGGARQRHQPISQAGQQAGQAGRAQSVQAACCRRAPPRCSRRAPPSAW